MSRNRRDCAHGIAAVIVAYFPDDAFLARVQRIGSQVETVVIVDNGGSSPIQERLRAFASGRVELIENARNEGIARALNQGVVRAAARGCSWVLTLDQDSEVDGDLIESLVAIRERCADREQVGLIHSNARSKWSGLLAVRCADPNAAFIEAKTVVTSGSLLSISAYRAAGPFREDFFIEGVDLEYCLRLRGSGFHILLSCKPLMIHAAGGMEERRLGRRIVLVANHAPWRHYYMTRNLLRIIAWYAFKEPLWSLTALMNLGKTVTKVLLFEDRRLAKLVCMLVGTWDALVGSTRVKFVPDRS